MVEGNVVKKYDMKHDKVSKCGTIATLDDELVYVTRKRQVLRKLNSLGVSSDILDFLREKEIEIVIFKLGDQEPYRFFRTSVEKLYQTGIPFRFKNEEEITYHIPLSRLEECGDPFENDIDY